ncbi:MAG: hypothetical protein IT360_25530 [Gemmatimonadaceae bacterium]|nr:hypothetical protein [Gemmatimonadaceae bacterium]
MPTKKSGLSRDEHVQLGEVLARMRDEMVTISARLGNAYPVAVGNLASRVQVDLDKLRSKLDDIVFREYPNLQTKGNISVYYPKRDDR